MVGQSEKAVPARSARRGLMGKAGSMRLLRVGLVGCGHIALTQHLPILRRLKDRVQLVAGCDLDGNRAREAAARFGVPHAYQDAQRMLEEQGLDVVDICAPPQAHLPLVVAAAQAGCHVLVEKPMALTVAEADAMIEAAEHHGVKLCVVHNALFNPAVAQARAMIDQGALGEVVGLQIRCLFDAEAEGFLNPEHWVYQIPGGMLGEVCPHQAYVAVEFLGDITSVQAKARRRRNIPWLGADELLVLLETPTAWGTIFITGNSPRFEFGLELYGTRQSLRLDMQSAQLVRLGPRRYASADVARDNLRQGAQILGHTARSGLQAAFGQLRNGHRRLIEAFVEAIQEDAPPPVSGLEARRTVALLESIWKCLA